MIDDRLPWFHCYPGPLLGALAGMKPDQQLVYVVILLRIYEVRGPCPDNLDAIARRVGINKRRVSDALDVLFRTEKLYRDPAGIMNPKAADVLAGGQAKHEKRVRAGAEGGKRSAEKRQTKQQPTPSKASARRDQEDSEKERTLFPIGKSAADDVSTSTAMKDPPLDPEADLYRRGKQVLGTNAGGMIRNLLAAKGGNVALARAAIEQASTRGDARQYVGAMIRPVRAASAERAGNGAAALLVKLIGGEGDVDDVQDVHAQRALPAGSARRPAGHIQRRAHD